MKRSTLALFAAALLAALPAVAQTNPSAVPLLVSTAWLDEHLQDPKVVVLYTDQGAHDEALIAGARTVPHESLMTMQGGHGLSPTDVLVEALRKAGVSNDSHVVVYGEPLSAGWLFFVLDYLGHPRVSVLDASIQKWRSENRPFARTPVAPPRSTAALTTAKIAPCSAAAARISPQPRFSSVASGASSSPATARVVGISSDVSVRRCSPSYRKPVWPTRPRWPSGNARSMKTWWRAL